MSGLSGIIHWDGSPADTHGLDGMLRAGGHRGPDGRTVWTEDGCALGHLALNLTDIDQAEVQPVQDATGRFVLIADGRVDGRADLLRALQRAGHPAATTSGPATLLLNAYLAWGERFMSRVLGDWAFGLWDRSDQRLLLARSPQGIRPMYYRAEENRVLFASEVGQILAAGGVPRRLFRPMAGAWLLVHPGDREWTFFEGIRQLPDGSMLEVVRGGQRMTRGWDIDPTQRLSYRSDLEYAEAFQEILRVSVEDRLAGPDPTSMLLSGGLDSTAVAGAAGWLTCRDPARVGTGPIITLSYRYDGFPECDERHISAPLARHWGMRIEEIAAAEWRPDSLLAYRWGVDSPAIGIYRPLQDAAMSRAREMGARQILIAARGDNMMGTHVWDAMGLITAGRVAEGFGEMRAITSMRGSRMRSTVRREVLRWARYRLRSSMPRGEVSATDVAEARARTGDRMRTSAPWLAPAFIESLPGEAMRDEPTPQGFRDLSRALRAAAVSDPLTALGSGQNARRATEYGLQYDDPWGDRRIVEFVCAVPQYVLNRVAERKRLTRLALDGLVPAAVQRNASKIIPASFGEHALRTKEARSMMELTHGMVSARAGLVDEPAIRAHVAEFLEGGDFHSEAWSTITLEAWLRKNEIEV